MRVHVEYTAQLRSAVGRSADEVDFPDCGTLLGLLIQLAAACEAARPHLIAESSRPRPSLLLVVNGAAVPTCEAAATILQDGDVVTLLPPIAGG